MERNRWHLESLPEVICLCNSGHLPPVGDMVPTSPGQSYGQALITTFWIYSFRSVLPQLWSPKL